MSIYDNARFHASVNKKECLKQNAIHLNHNGLNIYRTKNIKPKD